jgi:class 3 adenylate cyclase/DNA-binding SARP family transcriptional activator/predicted ATPase
VERETRTVLFTDVEGSTSLRTSRGDDVADAVVKVHDDVVHAAVATHSGTIVKGTGDGCLVIFGSARAAVAAAIEIQRRLLSGGTGPNPPPKVRIGINAGDVRSVDGDVLGEAVNAAARIADRASGGEILASRVVRDLVGSADVPFADRGDHELKGFPEPWALYAVGWSEHAANGSGLEIRLLGEVVVSVDGEPLEEFATPRLQRVLAHLTLDPGVVLSRSRLAFELWPDSTEGQARTNLRKLLHDLRHALPDAGRYVDVDGQSLRWRRDAPANVDLITFTEAVAREDFATANQAYGGDFLPGCYDDWALSERDRLRNQAIDCVRRLATDAADRSDDVGVLEHTQRLLRLDPLCEAAYRLSMQALARQGDRAEALRVYHRCVEILERELGVEPDAATRELYEAQRAGSGATSATLPAVTRRATAGTAPLVGRHAERDRAQDVWRAAAAGRAHLLLVTGEPGIGKSRLVDELAREVAAQGYAVGRTRAYEAGGRLPWGPAIDWLRSEALRASVGRLDRAWLVELARLLPELRTDRSDLPSASSIVDVRRRQLFDAVAQVVLVHASPLLLVVDDLQWSDADTVELIGFLIQHAPEAPLLIAGTVRSEEVDDDHPLAVLTAGLRRDDALTEIALNRLDGDATAELAARLTGSPLDQVAGEQFWRETEGNPLFVVEAARAGLAAGVGHASLTPTVQAVIGARLAGLSPEARRLIEVAATVGRGFTVDVLTAATGIDEDALADTLDDLWRRQIIREQGPGYDFTHDKLREVAHAGISPARRQRLHRVVGEVLATIHAADLAPVSADLAAHYEQAGLAAQAIDAYRQAAEHAMVVFSLADAIASLRRALLLLGQLPGGPSRDETELELRIALGAPLVAREGYGSVASEEAYERAAALCRRLGRPVDPPILRGLGLAALVGCRFDRSRHFGEELLEQGDENPVAAVEGHYLIGVSEFWRANLAESRHHLEAVLATYRPEHTAEHLGRYAQDPKAVCTVRLALTLLWGGEAELAAERAREAIALAESLDHPPTSAYVLQYAAIVAAEAGDRARLAATVETAEALFAQHELNFMMSIGRLLRGWLDVLDRRPGALERLADAVDVWRNADQTLHLTHGLTLLARASLLNGDLEGGRAAVREGIEWGIAHDQRYAEAALWRVDGELLAAAGDPAGAEAAFRQALAVADAQGARWLHQRAERSLGELQSVP